MDKNILIAPSTHPCPLADLQQYARKVINEGADWIHCDIMDGKFVENKTFDEIALSILNKGLNAVLDVHLMIVNPMDKLVAFAKAGAQNITVHFEAFDSTIKLMNTINKIHDLGCKAGISIKPNTPINSIKNILPFVDLILVMTVEPGKSGQSFLNSVLPKIAELDTLRQSNKMKYLIEVDGGINLQTAGKVIGLGADVLVIGSALFNATNKFEFIKTIKSFER